MTGIVLQARLGSTRLSRKALLPLGGLTILESSMRRLARIPSDICILATEPGSASEFEPLARQAGFQVFVGPEEDVLARFCGAIREYGLDLIVRATADNPFVSPEAAEELLRNHKEKGADYSAYRGLPLGFGVEIVRAASLLTAEEEAEDPYEREHVCPFLYRHPERFYLLCPGAPAGFSAPEARITVDTAEDYAWALRAMAACGEDPASDKLAEWLRGTIAV